MDSYTSNEAETPEALQYSSRSRERRSTRRARHAKAYADKTTDPTSPVLWTYLWVNRDQLQYSAIAAQILNRPAARAGRNGQIYTFTLPMRIHGSTFTERAFTSVVKSALSEDSDSLEWEFWNSTVAIQHLNKYWPVFVEPYFWLDAEAQTIQTAFAIAQQPPPTIYRRRPRSYLVMEAIPHVLTLQEFASDHVTVEIIDVLFAVMRFVCYLLADWFGVFAHNDLNSGNIAMDTLGNDYSKPRSSWTYVEYQFPTSRAFPATRNRTFCLPMRVYIIDLARSVFHPSIFPTPAMALPFHDYIWWNMLEEYAFGDYDVLRDFMPSATTWDHEWTIADKAVRGIAELEIPAEAKRIVIRAKPNHVHSAIPLQRLGNLPGTISPEDTIGQYFGMPAPESRAKWDMLNRAVRPESASK